jgi:O-antigen ligase
VVSLGGLVGYLALRSTAFMQRLTDLNNLLARFTYWQLGMDVFGDHKLLGVGHMQFQKVYLNYVHYISDSAQFDITQIFVLDNIYLTTLTEHGLVGFVGLIALFVCTWVLLGRLRRSLLQANLQSQASLMRTAQLVLVVYAVSGFFADVNQFTKATKFFFIVIGFALGAGARSLRVAKGVEIDDVFELEHAR